MPCFINRTGQNTVSIFSLNTTWNALQGSRALSWTHFNISEERWKRLPSQEMICREECRISPKWELHWRWSYPRRERVSATTVKDLNYQCNILASLFNTFTKKNLKKFIFNWLNHKATVWEDIKLKQKGVKTLLCNSTPKLHVEYAAAGNCVQLFCMLRHEGTLQRFHCFKVLLFSSLFGVQIVYNLNLQY